MSSIKIHGAERPVNRLLSDDFAFHIPTYQRPFAWSAEDAVTLIDDLLTSIGGDPDADPATIAPYFLGSLVLIKRDGNPHADVVDGQQRLSTLTILLAVLRELVSDASLADELEGYIYTKGHVTKGTKDHYRVTLRTRDRDFFRQYVQTRGSLDRLENLDPSQLDGDGQRRIREVTLAVREKLKSLTDQQQKQLAIYVLLNCIVVVVTSADMESAFRIFSVLNDRGVNLSATDILKAEIVGAIEDEQLRGKAAEHWEGLEDELGRDDFLELFSHIRMIFRKQMISSLLGEFREFICPKVEPVDFVDRLLTPYAKAFQVARDAQFTSTFKAEEINRELQWLQRIDNVDWYPPAIVAIQKWEQAPEKLLAFLCDLERLAAVMLINRANRTQRSTRYARLLEAIEREVDLNAVDSPLQLSAGEKNDALSRLRGPVYTLPGKVPLYILLRLDLALSAGGAEYNLPVISIEHVMPQNPDSNSEWAELFPDEKERIELLHTLGNLVLLSRRKNASARNWEFKRKKEKYFSGKDGVSPFTITTGVLKRSSWTSAVIREQTNQYVKKLAEVWKLT